MKTCSLCDRPENEVFLLISHPRTNFEIFLCDECIELDFDIVEHYRQQALAKK